MRAHLPWLLFALVLLLAPEAHAHPLTPAALVIRELAPFDYEVTFRRPERLARELQLQLPSDCVERERRASDQGDQRVDAFAARCARSLEGRPLRILGLSKVELSALVHVTLRSGETRSELLSPYRTSFAVPVRSTWGSVLAEYLRFGMEHLFTGLDHLLFIFGLLLLVSGFRARLLSLTAFTAGHSITLCLAAVGLIEVPQIPVEIGIAASLLVLAYEILEPSARFGPWWMAGCFGLLHGLGFAGALSEAGLPSHAVPLALFGFNLGIEVGQVLVVLLVTPCLALGKRYFGRAEPRARLAAAYALGGVAAMYCIERTLLLFGP